MELEEKGKEESAGAPLWMATFADLMSLLLAFFVLLFSFASMDDQRFAEIGGSIQDAFGMEQKIDQSDLMGMTQIEGTFTGGKPGMSILLLALNKSSEQMKRRLDVNKSGVGGEYDEAPPEELKALASYLILAVKEELLRKLLGDDKLEKDMRIEFTENTFLITLPDDILFEPGSIELKKSVDTALKITAQLALLVQGTIEIFGHTDSTPYQGLAARDNWELSARRAVTVGDKLIELTRKKPVPVEAIGRGATEPLVSNEIEAGRKKNRRVEIKIEHPNILETALEALKKAQKQEEEEVKPKSIFRIPDYLMRVPSKVADPTDSVTFFEANLY